MVSQRRTQATDFALRKVFVLESEQVHDGGDDHGHGVPDDGKRVEGPEGHSEKPIPYDLS